ncbi:MAG TPA: HAMP domain-containing protein [Nitrospirota bacterium]|nr:HAMP domain-containing protein [Nitrospirota bacterium]
MRKPMRRNYLVHKGLQIKYAVMVIALLLIYTIILMSAIFGPAFHILSSGQISLAERAETAEAVLLLNSSMWPWICLVVLLFGGISIFITHRLAGPVFAIKRMLKTLGDGDFSARIRLRKGAELQDLGDAVNDMADRYESFVSSLDERLRNVAIEVRAMARQNEAVNKSSLLSEIEAVEQLLEKCTFKKKEKIETP